MSLCLSRRPKERILLILPTDLAELALLAGAVISIQAEHSTSQNHIRFGLDAPKSINIVREEIAGFGPRAKKDAVEE